MRLVCDIETNGLLETVSKIWCICAIDLDTRIEYRFGPSQLDGAQAILEQASVVVFHNGINYDTLVLDKVLNLKLTNIYDTLVVSRVAHSDMFLHDESLGKRHLNKLGSLWGSHSLKAWGLRLGILKGDFNEHTSWQEYSTEMLEYCMQDVRVTLELYNYLQNLNIDPRCIEIEHKFAFLCQTMMDKGMPFDIQEANTLASTWEKELEVLEAELQRAFKPKIEVLNTPDYYEITIEGDTYRGDGKKKLEDLIKTKYPKVSRKEIKEKIKEGPNRKRYIAFNPRSSQQIAERLAEKYNWKPTELTEQGQAKTSGDILKALPYPEAQTLGRFKDLTKLHDMIKAGEGSWLNCVRPNGRLYGKINTNGAVSGRCTHSSPNLGQIPAHSEEGAKCRKLFTASPGRILVGWDASGLELRCLSHYLHRFDNGDYGKECSEGDIHTKNQQAADLPTRDNAKTFIYGLIYGAGDAKIGEIIGGSRIEGAQLKAKFFDAIPAIRTLIDSVEFTAKQQGYLKGLDGRHLPIRKKHAALNTALQSAGAVLMKLAGIKQEQALRELGIINGVHYDFLMNVHDEYVLDCNLDVADTILEEGIKALSHAGHELNFRCKLDAEGAKGQTWADIH